MAEETELSNSIVLVRSWRTAFLTLRDETQTQSQIHSTDTLISVLPLLDELVFAHFNSFVAASPLLPPHEVTSDLMYLLNVAASSDCTNEGTGRALYLICHLIYNIALRVPLALSSSAWSEMLGSFSKIAKYFIENAVRVGFVSDNSTGIKATKDCLETIRHLISMDPRRSSTSENIQLVEFLLHIVVCCHSELNGSYQSNGNMSCRGDSGKRIPQHASLWKVQTTAFCMVSESFARVGSSFPLGTWQSVVEVLRKVMDSLAAKMLIAEDGVLSRFYTSVLQCLHLVLVNRKGSLSDHLAAFVAALRVFLAYGLNTSSSLSCHGDKDPGPSSHRFSSKETIKKDVGAYRPPHLRRRTGSSLQQPLTKPSQISSDHDSSPLECSSSDSDYSDSDIGPKDFDTVRSCKARVAAINCIQNYSSPLKLVQGYIYSSSLGATFGDLTSGGVADYTCKDIPYNRVSMTVNLSVMAFLRRLNTNDSLHSADLAFSNYKQFGVVTLGLLTTSEGLGILNSKGYSVVETLNMSRTALWDREDLCEADPKAFIAQWTMLLPTNDVLQPRKYEATLMTCLLFDPFLKTRLASASAIAAMLEEPSSVALQVAEYRDSTKCGSYMALSSSLGQILMQLHSGVLYLIQHERHTGLLTSLFKILMLLISSTPYSRMPGELLPRVLSSLRLRIEEGFSFKNDQTSLLAISINCLTGAVSTSPSSSHVNEMFEAEISAGLYLDKGGSGVLITLLRHAEQVANPPICLEALQALKALCHNYPNIVAACWKQISATVYQILRPDTFRLSYSKGAFGHESLSSMDKVVSSAVKVLDECLRAVSGFKGTEDLFGDRLGETPFVSDFVRDKKISSAPSYDLENVGPSRDNLSGNSEWSEAIEKHISISICHVSGMVRAASITCFAGITCAVLFSLRKQQQQFILSSCIKAANDSVPSVRAATCRAIGVIACFPEIFKSAEILHEFINAVEVNTHDQPVLVRVTASWALANICDSFRHSVSEISLDSEANFRLVTLLECSLKLTTDGDKIKSNAVRALGNLSRVIPFANPLEQGKCPVTCPGISKMENFSWKCTVTNKDTALSSDPLGCVHLLEKIVQAFLSCITTGNVKVQWNVCHALSNLFLNESLRMQRSDWASSIYSILLLLLRDSSNYKIRIQAAAALAVPSTVLDYGSSFSDVVQSIQHILENLTTDQHSTPSFKYRIALEKQLTASMLHVLGLCSSNSHEPLKEFLLKKALFIECWLKDLCSSLEIRIQQDDEVEFCRNQKRELVLQAIKSLIEVYESKNQSSLAQKLQKLIAACG